MTGGMCGSWGMCGRGLYVVGTCVVGACTARRMCGRGACMAGGAWWEAGETATAADGTHPTGMHSC